MSWQAKYTGGYSVGTQEATDNIYQISGLLNYYNYTRECEAGIIGNIIAESALNPWRWQNDSYNLSNGYGLFQYTPASDYVNYSGVLANHNPARYSSSTPSQSSFLSGNAIDGEAQVVCFADNLLSKWVGTCWRSYWNPSDYPTQYALSQHCLATYGNGSYITMSQFSACSSIEDATFIFLACFEGPAIPNYTDRYNNALSVVSYLTNDIITPGSTPPGPTPPGPTPTVSKSKFWMYLWPY